MPPGRNDETAFAIRELTKEVERLREDHEKLINERFATLLKQNEKNEELIRLVGEAIKTVPNSLDDTVRELFAKEFSAERSLEMARKILDGLRQGMHLFLGGTLSSAAKPGSGGLVPAAAFPLRKPNRFTAAAQEEEDEAAAEEQPDPKPGALKKRETTASFSIDKAGKMDISVDTSSRAAVAAAIVALVSAVGWAVTAILHAAKQ